MYMDHGLPFHQAFSFVLKSEKGLFFVEDQRVHQRKRKMEKGDNQVKEGEGSLMVITDSENGSMSTCLGKSLYLHSRYDIHTLSVFYFGS